MAQRKGKPSLTLQNKPQVLWIIHSKDCFQKATQTRRLKAWISLPYKVPQQQAFYFQNTFPCLDIISQSL